jgi:tetratricopeptide (TPR) repeat protein
MLAAIAAGEGNRAKAVKLLDAITPGLNSISEQIAYTALVGQAYARYGAVDKARKLLTYISPRVHQSADDEVAFASMLRAEVEAASGDPAYALTLLKPPSADDDLDTKVVLRESLAHIHQQMGDLNGTIYWYGQWLQDGDQPIAGWEAQAHLPEAYFALAADNFKQGNNAAAQQWLAQFMSRWQNADHNLPLFREANQLQTQISDGRHGESIHAASR